MLLLPKQFRAPPLRVAGLHAADVSVGTASEGRGGVSDLRGNMVLAGRRRFHHGRATQRLCTVSALAATTVCARLAPRRLRGVRRQGLDSSRRGRGPAGAASEVRVRNNRSCACRALQTVETIETVPAPAEPSTLAPGAPKGEVGRPLQVIKIDLESNSVVIGDEEIAMVEQALKRTGVEKVAVVGVMGAFRTGKSFLLDLMLRYLREEAVSEEMLVATEDECEIPAWVQKNDVPAWAVKCGDLVEGREGKTVTTELSGFLWRPGMDKCTEGIWIWSEAFVLKSRDEDVAVLLMDTQGAWDAKMTKEQSATIFGLTTLMTSRLVYNVSKQIQQDKIDNLTYFVDFAQAALRSKAKSLSFSDGSMKPFQTLEFLVRDWPHYAEGSTVDAGRRMMVEHLDQYMDPKQSEDTQSIKALQEMFDKIDVWCLPHPSLEIERESWNGDLAVIDASFWRFMDEYMKKVFSSTELCSKTNMGAAITVDTFAPVLREFITAFRDAAPQAQTFAEAMETSTSLLARGSAMKLLKKTMMERSTKQSEALAPKDFDSLAAEVSGLVEEEYNSKAIFGNEQGIRAVGDELKADVAEELERYREENERRLEASLAGLATATLGGIGAFFADRASDITCDWWLPLCQELSNDLFYGYAAVFLYVAYSLNNIQTQQGSLGATVAAIELAKAVVKKGSRLADELQKPPSEVKPTEESPNAPKS